MMRVHFIQHADYEPPGAFRTWAESRNYEITYSRIFENELLPASSGC